MKKILAFVALFACLLGLASCTTKVAGKTYVYDSFTYEVSEDATVLDKVAAEAACSAAKAAAQLVNELVFSTETEGDVWTQDGKTVKIAEFEFTVKGNKLVQSKSTDTYSYTITFVEKK